MTKVETKKLDNNKAVEFKTHGVNDEPTKKEEPKKEGDEE